MLGIHWVSCTLWVFFIPEETCDSAMTFLQARSKRLSLFPAGKKKNSLASLGGFKKSVSRNNSWLTVTQSWKQQPKLSLGPLRACEVLWSTLCAAGGCLQWLLVYLCIFLEAFVYTTSSDPILRWEGISLVLLCRLTGLNLGHPVTTFFTTGGVHQATSPPSYLPPP